MRARTAILFGIGFVLTVFSGLTTHAAESTDSLRHLPVQDAGRVKPFDTLARETLQLVYGSQTYKTTKGDVRPAVEIVMTWMMVPQIWDGQKIVEINHKGLKDSLKLPADEKYFSPTELFGNERLSLVMQELGSYRETKQKLNPYFQAAQRLESQLGMYQAVKQGTAIRVVPPLPTSAEAMPADAPQEPERWIPVAELDGDLKDKFGEIARAFIHALPGETPADAASASGSPSLKDAVAHFMQAARDRNPALYPSERSISIEVHYKSFHPFMIAWIFYLLAALLLGISWQADKALLYRLGWVSALIALSLHTYGFVLRMVITGRPPVSNMYESVVWVSWGCVIFAMIFEFLGRKKFVLLAGASVAVLCLIVADLAPTILDSGIQPLEPVLRSNMWLTVHVLTITLSYSAFFLAWGLGNIGLAFILRGDKPTSERVRALALSVYRSIQVGVVLLAAGTILGGVWADYSWGRFWGWDPKETWAFIALMGYLALLHARLSGWAQNFGTMAGAVVAFNLVLMAWYGVNFVLGAGLHSYGFGAGGVEYVGAFVAVDLIFLGYVAYIRFSKDPARA